MYENKSETKAYGSSSAKKVTISKFYNAKTKKKVKAYKKAKASGKSTTLKKGTTVKVLKAKGNWLKTNKGWILKKNLKAVKIKNAVTMKSSVESSAAPSGSASGLTAGRI